MFFSLSSLSLLFLASDHSFPKESPDFVRHSDTVGLVEYYAAFGINYSLLSLNTA